MHKQNYQGVAVKIACWLILVSCASCVAGPETSNKLTDAEYRRADERLRIIEEFEMRKEACRRAGGSMQVSRTTDARMPARPRDLRRASCQRLAGFGSSY